MSWHWHPESGLLRNPETGEQQPLRLAQLEESRYQVWLAGQVYEVVVEPKGPRRAGAGQRTSQEKGLKASMPGNILAVKAAPGDEVEAGQVLIVMESMKMELSLESPRSAKVARVLVQPGQLVQLGELLLELEG